MVNNLQQAFEKATKKYFEQNSSDEEVNLEYPDLKTNVFREKNSNTKNLTPKIKEIIGTKGLPSKLSAPATKNTETGKKTKDTSSPKAKATASALATAATAPAPTAPTATVAPAAAKKATKTKGKRAAATVTTAPETKMAEKGKINEPRGIKRKRKEKDKRRKKKSKSGKGSKNKHSDSESGSDNDDIDDEDEEDYNDNGDVGIPAKRAKLNTSPTKQKKVNVTPATSPKKPQKAKDTKKEAAAKKKKESKKIMNEVEDSGTESDDENEPDEVTPQKNVKAKGRKKGKKDVVSPEPEPQPEPKIKDNNKKKASKNKNATVAKTEINNKKEAKENRKGKKGKGPATSKKVKDDTQANNVSKSPVASDNESPVPVATTPKKSKTKQTLKEANKSSKEKHNVENVTEKQSAKTVKKSKKPAGKNEQNQNIKQKLSKKDNKSGKVKKSKSNKISKGTTIEKSIRSRSASHSSDESVSPNVFTVDLHKKYSQSASKFSPTKSGKSNANKGDDRLSTSSFSRSPSPLSSHYSSNNSLNSLDVDNSTTLTKSKKAKRKSSRKTANDAKVKDKFDLIKERRSRNTDDKWKQVVKDVEKIKDGRTSGGEGSTTKVPEKNQKLKETIEKLKQKNKQSKESTTILNELFNAKPSKGSRDEKSIFDKLRVACGTATESSKADNKLTSKADEYNFVDDSVPKGKKKLKEKSNKPNKEKPAKSPKKVPFRQIVNATKKSNKTNMEALELETEQTLKDINRWLEHTPRYPEFNSASNSPSRFNNLLDDFDTVTAKLDPADFRRPVALSVETAASAMTTSPSKSASASNKLLSPKDRIQHEKDGTSSATSPVVHKQTIQLTGIPPPPGPHKRELKEPKRKSLKEKITGVPPPKRKDVHRTIERLQPGKTKGNLINTIHNALKPEDTPLHTSSIIKPKEVKNSLVQETKDSGPKLSLGTVLNTAGFGLGQQHNFGDENDVKGKMDIMKLLNLNNLVF